MKNVLKGHRAEDVSIIYRQDFIAASRVADGQAWTVIRPPGPAAHHLVRDSEAASLSEPIGERRTGIKEQQFWIYPGARL